MLVDIATKLEMEGARRIGDWMLQFPDGFETLEEVADAIAEYTPQRKRRTDLESLKRVVRQHPDGRYRWHWDPNFMGQNGPAEVANRELLLEAAGNLSIPTLRSGVSRSCLSSLIRPGHWVTTRPLGDR